MKNASNIDIRNGKPTDHETIMSVMPAWWDGRDLRASVLKVFFHHFQDTIFIAEKDCELAGFLVGFLSQTNRDEGYIHFAGVRPGLRKAGIGRALYERFFAICWDSQRSVVRSCTSPVNTLSIAFHRRMGFEMEPGDTEIGKIPVNMHYLRLNDPKVLFKKILAGNGTHKTQ